MEFEIRRVRGQEQELVSGIFGSESQPFKEIIVHGTATL